MKTLIQQIAEALAEEEEKGARPLTCPKGKEGDTGDTYEKDTGRRI